MYDNIYIHIVINGYKSDKVYLKRGFMEGHPPSMAAFVISLIPLMYDIEKKVSGITLENKTHRLKMFADDLKLFISNLNEVQIVSNSIMRFEAVSGLEMHRDPHRNKCQALPFGQHRQFIRWPEWVSVKNQVKIVGAIFTNEGNLEKLNSELVSKCFLTSFTNFLELKEQLCKKCTLLTPFCFLKFGFLLSVSN